MIRSMTGYGRAQRVQNGYDILVEIKSVNHRYFEFSARVPRAYGYVEEKMKTLVQKFAKRGKVDVNVSIHAVEGADANVDINHSLAKGYMDALRSVQDELDLKDDLTLRSLAHFNDIFTVSKTIEDEAVVWNAVRPVAEEALERFVSMRQTEGEKLKADVLSRLIYIEETVSKIEVRSPQTLEEYQTRLYNKIKEVLAEKDVDDQRVLTEVAIFADKIAVDEETVRLRSHIKQIREMLDNTNEPIGRKLDFIVQELNREINTTGSKAQDLEIAHMVVDVKAEIEKIREQIQNIE